MALTDMGGHIMAIVVFTYLLIGLAYMVETFIDLQSREHWSYFLEEVMNEELWSMYRPEFVAVLVMVLDLILWPREFARGALPFLRVTRW